MRTRPRPAILIVVLALLLAGCGGGESEQPPTPGGTEQGPTASASPLPTRTPTAVQTVTSPPGETVTPTTPEADVVAEFTVSEGAVEGPQRVQAAVGDVVQLVVTSEVQDEVHVHGFDISRDVNSGQTVTLEFEVDVPGVFEVEMESRSLKITELEIR